MGLGERLGGGGGGVTSVLRLLVALCAVTLVIGAGVFGIFAWVIDQSSIDDTIKSSRVIDAKFQAGARIAERFFRLHGRWPTTVELATEDPPTRFNAYSVAVSNGGDEQACEWDIGAKSKHPRQYILTVWRGEWLECYDVASHESTLTFEPERYTETGSVEGDKLFFAVLAVTCLVGGRRLGEGRYS